MPFPTQQDGLLYLTEGGTETEIMYKFRHQLPEFATYPLLDKPDAVAALKGMYERYLQVCARHGFAALMAGLDYRLSPDWGAKLGYSRDELADMQARCIDFLRDVAKPFENDIPKILIAGVVGPRGDAYSLNRTITEADAEDYHGWQLGELARNAVDLAWAATFNNIPEAVGVSRAAKAAKVPLTISFTLTSDHRLRSGVSLREAVEETDRIAGDARPDFYGINCSHPVEFEPALEPGDWFTRVRSLRPNAAKMDKVALCKIGHLEEGDPEELGEMMGALAARYPHLDIFGGCCGSWETHLDLIARDVKAARAA